MLFHSSEPPIEWLNYHEHVYLAETDHHVFKINCNIYSQIENYLAMVLTKPELEKMSRFFKKDDAIRFALGKYFIRKIVSKKLNIEPANIDFLLTNENKPYLPGVEFNISHSGNYVTIAISNKPIGIDVEMVKNHFDHDELARACFTLNERKLISNLHDFYIFWTRKEAILKASGEGLVDNLLEIECISQTVKRHQNIYELRSYAIDENHLMSLAHDESIKNFKFWSIDAQ